MTSRRMKESQKQRARSAERLKKAKLYCLIYNKELNGVEEVWDHTLKYHFSRPDFESILNVHNTLLKEKKEISRSTLEYFDFLLELWKQDGVKGFLYALNNLNRVIGSPNFNQTTIYNKVVGDFEFLRKKNETLINEDENVTKNQNIGKTEVGSEPKVKKEKSLTTEEKWLLEIEGKVKNLKNEFRDIKNMIRPYENSPKKLISKLKVLKSKLDGIDNKTGLSENLSLTVRNLRDSVNNEINRKVPSSIVKSSKKGSNENVLVYIESLVFEDRKVELIRKKGSVKFGLHSSKKVLNEFKNEYFGKQVFKFYLENNQVIKEESPGYKLLEEKIQSYRILKKSNKKNVDPISIINKKFDANQIVELLKEKVFRNKYLKEAAGRLKMETDFVVTFEENNNGTKEQGLFFVYKRTTSSRLQKAFILYENSVEQRAAYLFKVKEEYSEKIIKDLLAFAQSSQKNKRDSLFRKKFSDLGIERIDNWEVIVHGSKEHYSKSLKIGLNS